MSLFSKLSKRNNGLITVSAPVKGTGVPISEVNDPVFSGEIMGKGIAIIPREGTIISPVRGTVSTIFETGHAVAITSEEGPEILIHVGLDTVALKGMYFKKHVEDGQHIEKGTLLIEADIEKIKEAGYDTTIPVTICNTIDYKEVEGVPGEITDMTQTIITIKK